MVGVFRGFGPGAITNCGGRPGRVVLPHVIAPPQVRFLFLAVSLKVWKTPRLEGCCLRGMSTPIMAR